MITNIVMLSLMVYICTTVILEMLSIGVCDPLCQNGGNCTSPGQCRCTLGWEGNHCEQGMYCIVITLCKQIYSIYHSNHKVVLRWNGMWNLLSSVPLHFSSATCSPPCQHGGACVAPNRCSCSADWVGQHCETGM